jgi:hypothetical protein
LISSAYDRRPNLSSPQKVGRKTPWRPTLEWLRTIARDLPPEELPHGRVFMVAILFLKCVFGQSWLDEYVARIVPTGRMPGFLHPDLFGTHEMQTEKMQIHYQRVIDLAEMIFNFKAV